MPTTRRWRVIDMAKPRTLVLSGYGLNCEEETAFTFARAGAEVTVVHVNDLIDGHESLADFQILAIPGGFSYGDDTGSGNALANRIRNHLWEEIQAFVSRDTLTIGVCNGCQVAVNLGLITAPGQSVGERSVALLNNSSLRYQCRWVDLKVSGSASPWLKGLDRLHVPVAHGEGNFQLDDDAKRAFHAAGMVALRYVNADGTPAGGVFPANPNGSYDDIAGVTDHTGRILALMPHPERAIFFTQRDDWTLKREELRRAGKPIPEEGDGMGIFKNAVAYFA